MLLNHGEQIVYQSSVERDSDGRQGTLILTNQRIVFEGPAAAGLVSRALHGERTTMLFHAQLHQILDARVDRRLLGRPIFNVQTHAGAHRFKTDQADLWYQQVSSAKASAPPPVPWGPPQQGHVVVNVHAAQAPQYVPPPPPPPPMVFLHCRFCGNLNQPGSGRCVSCGAGL